jgi:hypothetical protein
MLRHQSRISSPDRAIDFTGTNTFVCTDAIVKGVMSGQLVDGDHTHLYSLAGISSIKGPQCRVDADHWDR